MRYNPAQPLKSISLLRPISYGTLPLPNHIILSHFHLQHLTIHLGSQLVNLELHHLPCLRSLHVLLQTDFDALDCVRVVDDLFRHNHHNLREYNLSGKDRPIYAEGLVGTEDLMMPMLAPLFKNGVQLDLLTIKDVDLGFDIGFDMPSYVGSSNCRFEHVVFDNVTYCLFDEITMSGPSTPKDIDDKWRPMIALKNKAKDVKIVQREGPDRWIKKSESN